jgi:hypothetical protein
MTQKARYLAENPVVFISDINGGRLPDKLTDEMVQHSTTCVIVRCMGAIDGEVELTLGATRDVEPREAPEFDGIIDTPNRRLMISGPTSEPIVQADVVDTKTRIRVWRNHPVWPDKVVVGWG